MILKSQTFRRYEQLYQGWKRWIWAANFYGVYCSIYILSYSASGQLHKLFLVMFAEAGVCSMISVHIDWITSVEVRAWGSVFPRNSYSSLNCSRVQPGGIFRTKVWVLLTQPGADMRIARNLQTSCGTPTGKFTLPCNMVSRSAFHRVQYRIGSCLGF